VLEPQMSEGPQEPDKNDKTDKKKKKKKDKVRSAWISFMGRIVAQVMGAIATVALGVTVLHNYKTPGAHASSPGDVDAPRRTESVEPPRPSSEVSVAVLPLENFSADATHDYFADGMTEAVIMDLSRIDSLRVISRTSSMHFKGQRKTLREIAQQLGARWIVEGSVSRAGERVRIIAQLIDAGTDQHAWADSYDRPVTDLLATQAEVAGAIARAVSAALPLHRPQSLSGTPALHRGEAPRGGLLTFDLRATAE
jgi:TolB-like protein